MRHKSNIYIVSNFTKKINYYKFLEIFFKGMNVCKYVLLLRILLTFLIVLKCDILFQISISFGHHIAKTFFLKLLCFQPNIATTLSKIYSNFSTFFSNQTDPYIKSFQWPERDKIVCLNLHTKKHSHTLKILS